MPSRFTVMALLLSLALPLCSCSSLESVLEDARHGDAKSRSEALFDLEARIRSLGSPSDEDAAPIVADRELVNRFLMERFEDRQETDPVIRANIIALALQVEAECAEELLVLGAADRDMLVRQQAVHGMRQRHPKNMRELLTDRLHNDPSLIVRIEAAKVFRLVGDGDWAEPLVRVIIDTTEDDSLRYQAFDSARTLTGEDLPFAVSEWRDWLTRNSG